MKKGLLFSIAETRKQLIGAGKPALRT